MTSSISRQLIFWLAVPLMLLALCGAMVHYFNSVAPEVMGSERRLREAANTLMARVQIRDGRINFDASPNIKPPLPAADSIRYVLRDRHGNLLAQERIRKTAEEVREMLTLLIQQRQDLKLGLRKLLLIHHASEKRHEIKAFERLQFRHAVHMLLQFGSVGDMNQSLGDRPCFRRGAKTIILLVNLFRHDQRILANRAESFREFFGSVVVHNAILLLCSVNDVKVAAGFDVHVISFLV